MQVLTKNGAVESYPYSIGNLRKDNPQVSFPKNPSPELMAQWNVFPVEPVGPPPTNMDQNPIEGLPVYDGGVWKQSWTVEQASAEEVAQRLEAIKGDIVGRTQSRLDAFAQTRNYAGILSLCTYAIDSNPKFAAEGQYGVEVRSETWAKLYEILAEVEAGTRPVPSSFDDIEPELPVFQWPE